MPTEYMFDPQPIRPTVDHSTGGQGPEAGIEANQPTLVDRKSPDPEQNVLIEGSSLRGGTVIRNFLPESQPRSRRLHKPYLG